MFKQSYCKGSTSYDDNPFKATLNAGELEVIGDMVASLIQLDPDDRAGIWKLLRNEWWYT